MKKGFLKQKAVFMIYLVVSLMLVTSFAFAEDTSEEANVCCEQTSGSEVCRYTTEDQCDDSYSISPTYCNSTSFCKAGACINEDQGTCSANVAQAACDAAGYEWYEEEMESLEDCNKGCCIIADGAATDWTTEDNCNYKQELYYPDLSAVWDTSYDDASCIALQYESVKGCCVAEDSCSYVTQAECDGSEVIDMSTGYGFYRGNYCDDVTDNLEAQGYDTECSFCAPEDHKGCVGEDVHTFDSCGNDNGVVENCDYLGGTYCGYDDEVMDYTCKDTYCDSTFDGWYDLEVTSASKEDRNPHDPKMGDRRENGESWCVYESPVGGLLDRPGSQHYRAFCWFGEEIIEPCRDYREEICVQNPYYGDGDDYTQAACLFNDIYESEISTDVSTVPKGQSFWEDEGSCSDASITCDVKEVKESNLYRWTILEGYQCLEQNFTNTVAQYCKFLGDCGADYDILGRSTEESFYMVGPEFINTDWKNLYKERLKEDDESITVEAIQSYINQDTWASINATVGKFWINEPSADMSPLSTVPDDMMTDVYYQNTERTEINDMLWDAWAEYGVHGGMRGLENVVATVSEGGYDPRGVNAAVWVFVGSVALTYIAITIVGYALGGTVALSLTSGFEMIIGAIKGAAGTAAAGGPIAGLVVLVVAIIAAAVLTILSLTGEKTQSYEINSNCEPWQPVDGGEYCHLCDVPVSEGGLAIDDGNGNVLSGYDCTEYKCKSLGKGCEFIAENLGTDRDKCYYAYENDASSPIIEFDPDAVNVEDFDYDTFGDGVEITTLVDPYKEFTFGIKAEDSPTGGPSQCRMDMEITDSYEEMAYPFPDTYFDVYHNYSMILLAETEYNFYIRCKDPAGNVNSAPYAIRVTTGSTQDFTPPLVLSASLLDGAYISSEINLTALTVYTNEPANCRWSNENTDYDLMDENGVCDDMPSTETIFDGYECMFALPIYQGENDFYIKCSDYEGNRMSEPYFIQLMGTVPLNITYAYPQGVTFYEDDVTLKVTTTEGADEGIATCYYDGIEFFTTNSNSHEQQLTDLVTGNYSYIVECVDEANNYVNTTLSFETTVDEEGPEITEVRMDAANIYVSLSEEATCEYKDESFSYGEGSALGTGTSFTLPLTSSKVYHLICEDAYGNQDESIIYI